MVCNLIKRISKIRDVGFAQRSSIEVRQLASNSIEIINDERSNRSWCAFRRRASDAGAIVVGAAEIVAIVVEFKEVENEWPVHRKRGKNFIPFSCMKYLINIYCIL
jgi:hypothetical protein